MSSVNLSPPGDRSLKELVSDLRHNTGLLVRQEIALAKAELKQKVAGVAKTAVTFGAAGLLGYAGVLAILATLVLGLVALGVAAWLATLIIAVVVLAGAFALVQRALHPTKKQDPEAT